MDFDRDIKSTGLKLLLWSKSCKYYKMGRPRSFHILGVQLLMMDTWTSFALKVETMTIKYAGEENGTSEITGYH